MLKWAILFSSYLCPKDPKKMPQGIRHLDRGLVMPGCHLNRFQCISKVAHLDLGHSVLYEWKEENEVGGRENLKAKLLQNIYWILGGKIKPPVLFSLERQEQQQKKVEVEKESSRSEQNPAKLLRFGFILWNGSFCSHHRATIGRNKKNKETWTDLLLLVIPDSQMLRKGYHEDKGYHDTRKRIMSPEWRPEWSQMLLSVVDR